MPMSTEKSDKASIKHRGTLFSDGAAVDFRWHCRWKAFQVLETIEQNIGNEENEAHPLATVEK